MAMREEENRLDAQMECAKFEFETDQLRRELKERETSLQRTMMALQQRTGGGQQQQQQQQSQLMSTLHQNVTFNNRDMSSGDNLLDLDSLHYRGGEGGGAGFFDMRL
jgi:hypothetical protein